MKKICNAMLFVIVLGASASAIAATTINFDTMTWYVDMPFYTEGDVTFTPAGGQAVAGVFGPNGTVGLVGGMASPQAEIRADIAGGATLVSVDLGDWNWDADTLFLEVYDSADILLGYVEQLIEADFVGMQTLSVSASGIAYARFGARYPADGGSSIVADNFTYGTVDIPVNSPPSIQPSPESQTIEIGVDPIIIVADVSDFDGDTLSYQWLKAGELLRSGSVETIQGGDVVPLPALIISAGDSRFGLGTHAIELSVSDGFNAPVVMQVTVIVIDSINPIVQPVPSVTMLWPPNHELRDVVVQANACDNSGGLVALSVNVVSSEPEDTGRCCDLSPDFYINSINSETGIIELQLRAERYSQNGRTYTITITATDAEENSSSAVISILVPHNRGRGGW